MTCASLGVTGTVGAGQVLLDRLPGPETIALADIPISVPPAGESGGTRMVAGAVRPASSTAASTAQANATGTPSSGAPSPAYTPPSPASGSSVLDRTAIERKRAAERAARAAARDPIGSAREIAQALVYQRGWSEDQWSCLDSLWNRESNWRYTATNPVTGAYGIPQALPGYKMASAGDDWQTNPATQIKWGLDYIANRYGTPCSAWSFWLANNWY